MRQIPIQLFAILCGTMAVAAADPPWLVPELNTRLVFALPRECRTAILVNVRHEPPSGRSYVFAARDPTGANLRHRIVHSAPERTAVLVAVSNPERREPYFLYFGHPTGALGPDDQSDTSLTDPMPISVTTRQCPSRSIPDSWERMAFLFHWASRQTNAGLCAHFDQLRSPRHLDGPDRHEDPTRRWHYAFLLRTYVLCPESGLYKFALTCRDAGFLFVDGESAAEAPGKYPQGHWREGHPLRLQAGLHLVELYNFTAEEPAVRLGWSASLSDKLEQGASAKRRGAKVDAASDTPTFGRIAPIQQKDCVAACEAQEIRIERNDRSVQPGFTFDMLPSYAIRTNAYVSTDFEEPIFTPVVVNNATRAWDRTPFSFRFILDGVPLISDGNEPWSQAADSTLKRRDPHVIVVHGARLHELAIQTKDAQGALASFTRTIDCRNRSPLQCLVVCSPVSLNAVCLPSDIVQPTLSISCREPEFMLQRYPREGSPRFWSDMTVSWSVSSPSAIEQAFELDVELNTNATVLVPMMKCSAGQIKSVKWKISHREIPISAGEIRFVAPPFSSLPVRASFDRLHDETGAQLVLVPSASTTNCVMQAPPVRLRRRPSVLWIDDFLPARPPTGESGGIDPAEVIRAALRSDRPTVSYVNIALRRPTPDAARTLDRLVCAVNELKADADITVISLGQTDMLERRDCNAFERAMAALADAILTLQCATIWVTIPPFGPNPADARPYAAAIRRITEARNIPTADMYTACMGLQDADRLFADPERLRLAPSAGKVLAELLARALGRQDR